MAAVRWEVLEELQVVQLVATAVVELLVLGSIDNTVRRLGNLCSRVSCNPTSKKLSAYP